jgi:hypothetical protein
MRKAFLEFLAKQGVVPSERLEELRNLLRSAPEPIGSIAFGHGMIGGGDIDVILDEQRKDYRPFGEIAMSMGMLTRNQVDALLRVQQMRGAVETAEALALSGICLIDDITTQLGRFFSQQERSPVSTRD